MAVTITRTIAETKFTFNVLNGEATPIDVVLEVYSNSGWVESVASTEILAAANLDYEITTNGLYRFSYTGGFFYLTFVDIDVRSCLKSLSSKIICGTATDSEIANFNSLLLSVQTLYNLLGTINSAYMNTVFSNFAANVPVATLLSYETIMEHLANYCVTESEEDCGCS